MNVACVPRAVCRIRIYLRSGGTSRRSGSRLGGCTGTRSGLGGGSGLTCLDGLGGRYMWPSCSGSGLWARLVGCICLSPLREIVEFNQNDGFSVQQHGCSIIQIAKDVLLARFVKVDPCRVLEGKMAPCWRCRPFVGKTVQSTTVLHFYCHIALFTARILECPEPLRGEGTQASASPPPQTREQNVVLGRHPHARQRYEDCTQKAGDGSAAVVPNACGAEPITDSECCESYERHGEADYCREQKTLDDRVERIRSWQPHEPMEQPCRKQAHREKLQNEQRVGLQSLHWRPLVRLCKGSGDAPRIVPPDRRRHRPKFINTGQAIGSLERLTKQLCAARYTPSLHRAAQR